MLTVVYGFEALRPGQCVTYKIIKTGRQAYGVYRIIHF